MSRNFFWYALSLSFAVLALLILSIPAWTPKPEPLAIGRDPVLPPPPNISAPAAISPPGQESPAVKSAVDTCRKIGKYQKLTGWAYVENQDTLGQEIYVQLIEPDGAVSHYSTISTRRPDVGKVFNNPRYNACGFNALIPRTQGRQSAFWLVVKTKQGIYKSKPCRMNWD